MSAEHIIVIIIAVVSFVSGFFFREFFVQCSKIRERKNKEAQNAETP
jgi:hypothetical protein